MNVMALTEIIPHHLLILRVFAISKGSPAGIFSMVGMALLVIDFLLWLKVGSWTDGLGLTTWGGNTVV
jgi:hypothetical protein